MKKPLCTLWLTAVLSLLPFVVNAQEGTAAYDEVNIALATSTSHSEIISLLMSTYFMTLSEATIFAMVSGDEANRVSFASAGVSLASNLAQAQGVTTAVKAAVGETGAVASAADRALEEFIATMAQPDVYEDKFSPTGGGDVSGSV